MIRKKRVGFIFDGLAPTVGNCLRHRTLRPLIVGWSGNSSIYHARFNWLACWINRLEKDLFYEVYRPLRRYDAIIFIKSMDESCYRLAVRMREKRCCPIFDLNVDYLTPAAGTFYYDGMAPTEPQREQAFSMVRACNAVIADSRHLQDIVRTYVSKTAWIPDDVPDDLIVAKSEWRPNLNKPLPLLWCGEAVKLFELLRIETVLRRLKNKVHLRIITNSLDALSRIYEPWQGRIRRFIADMDCEIIPYHGMDRLMAVYDQGGVFISPRFLDNTYNLGHTEWKITLPMARGRVVLCSGQPSYLDLAERTGGEGIRVCGEESEWDAAFDELLSGHFDWRREQQTACWVVRNHYAASVVGATHAAFVREILKIE